MVNVDGVKYVTRNASVVLTSCFLRQGYFRIVPRTTIIMMKPSNGNIFRVTGPLYWELTSYRWISLTKASDAELWCFLWSSPEQTVEQTIEAPVIWDAIALIMTSLLCSLYLLAWGRDPIINCCVFYQIKNNPFRCQCIYFWPKTEWVKKSVLYLIKCS